MRVSPGTIPQVEAVSIRPFEVPDQVAVKALVLAGLREHWGEIIPGLNPDLDNIAQSYAGSTFLVATQGGRVVGCGALVPQSRFVAEIVRLYVCRDFRRRGLGSLLLSVLGEQARRQGFRRLVLETTATWTGVRAFYEQFGFRFTHFVADELGDQAHYELPLGAGPAEGARKLNRADVL